MEPASVKTRLRFNLFRRMVDQALISTSSVLSAGSLAFVRYTSFRRIIVSCLGPVYKMVDTDLLARHVVNKGSHVPWRTVLYPVFGP